MTMNTFHLFHLISLEKLDFIEFTKEMQMLKNDFFFHSKVESLFQLIEIVYRMQKNENENTILFSDVI